MTFKTTQQERLFSIGQSVLDRDGHPATIVRFSAPGLYRAMIEYCNGVQVWSDLHRLKQVRNHAA